MNINNKKKLLTQVQVLQGESSLPSYSLYSILSFGISYSVMNRVWYFF